jgi:hypothetical protein
VFVAAGAGIVVAWRARVTAIRLLLLPVVSYYATFIAVVGYHYDRFFLAPIVALCVAAGWGLDRWLAPSARWRGLRVTATAAAFVYALTRVAALDTMMARDSRSAAEAWLLPHATAASASSARAAICRGAARCSGPRSGWISRRSRRRAPTWSW